MTLETNIQKRFVEIICSADKSALASPAHQTYSELIYYSLLENLEKAFPRFRKRLSEEVFKDLIYAFLKVGAKTPIFWSVAGEFKDFVLSQNTIEMDYMEDLLNYEFLELEMYMSNYTCKNSATFSFSDVYICSPEIRLERYIYPIHHHDFDERSEDFKRGEYFILFYYQEQGEQIIAEEISHFVYEFLNALDGKNTVFDLVHTFALHYEIEADDIFEIFEELLSHYVKNNIILKV